MLACVACNCRTGTGPTPCHTCPVPTPGRKLKASLAGHSGLRLLSHGPKARPAASPCLALTIGFYAASAASWLAGRKVPVRTHPSKAPKSQSRVASLGLFIFTFPRSIPFRGRCPVFDASGWRLFLYLVWYSLCFPSLDVAILVFKDSARLFRSANHLSFSAKW